VSQEESVYNVPIPAPKGQVSDDSDDEISIDEAERTLNSIIESTGEAQERVRRILNESVEESRIEAPEMSVWAEKSFFRRMAQKAPGGWAFTPQPKLGRMRVEETETESNVDAEIIKVCSRISLMTGDC
jgi:hypothetical protein